MSSETMDAIYEMTSFFGGRNPKSIMQLDKEIRDACESNSDKTDKDKENHTHGLHMPDPNVGSQFAQIVDSQSHICNVSNSGHFMFSGDLAKLAITFADIDRLCQSFISCLQLDVHTVVAKFG